MILKLHKKILVTGGLGYLGARIGKYLAAHGYAVDLGTRKPLASGLVEGCNHVVTDWDDPKLSFCVGYDLIIHAAGMSAGDCADNPTRALEFNGNTTARLVERASSSGCRKFFYLSTVHVYNSPLVGRFNEDSPTLNAHPYATSQLCGERAVIRSRENSSMDGYVLRLANCFGYPEIRNKNCWDLVLNEFVRDAYRFKKITIKGDSNARRDFLAITELNRILIRLIETTEDLPVITNISSGRSRTLFETAEEVSEVMSEWAGKTVEIFKVKYKDPPQDLFFDNQSLLSLGISPNSDLADEIRLTLNFLLLGD